MLRQSTTENKATKAHDSVTGPDGRAYHRAHYEDERNPGYTRSGMLYSSFEIRLCAGWGLISPSGHRFDALLPAQLTADPTRVSASEAPAPLRQAVANAEKRLKEVEAKGSAALDARDTAEREQHIAARAQDARRYNGAVVAAQEAEQQRLDAEMVLPPLRVEVTRANQALRWWMEDEGLRRSANV